MAILNDNIYMGLVKNMFVWSRELCLGLTFVDPTTDWRTTLCHKQPIDVSTVLKRAETAFWSQIPAVAGSQNPRASDCENRRTTAYHVFFSTDTWGKLPPYVAAPIPASLKCSLALLRTGM